MSRSDYDGYLAAVDRLLAVDGADDFMQCLRQEIRAVLPFGCVIGGMARIRNGVVVPELLLHHDFPLEYLDQIRGSDGMSLSSPILKRWLKAPAPLAFTFHGHCDLPTRALMHARRFEFTNVLAHGHYTRTGGGLLTYFSFHRLATPATPEQRLLLARLMPHMHCAVTRIQSRPAPITAHSAASAGRLAELSHRQQEIVSWLVRGKTNWEISRITGTSEANVKYHLSNLMRTYQVSSRSSLVFKLCQTHETPVPLSA